MTISYVLLFHQISNFPQPQLSLIILFSPSMRKPSNQKKTLTSLLHHFYPLITPDPRDSTFISLEWRTVHALYKGPSSTCELGSMPSHKLGHRSTNSVLIILPLYWIFPSACKCTVIFAHIFLKIKPTPPQLPPNFSHSL